MSDTNQGSIKRRAFVKGVAGAAAAAAGTFLIVKPGSVFGAEANSKLELGLIGCGGRGGWIADLFEQNSNTKVVAVHDYFEDRAKGVGDKRQVEAGRRFTGLDSYREMVKGKLDAVAIISPPYFHPDQIVAALEAGKHVYCAKPIAVDVPGCQAILAAAAKAAGKQSMLVDFQTRANEFYKGAAERIFQGILGKVVMAQAYYHSGPLGSKTKRKDDLGRMRNWVFDKVLSGDIIVEQNVHVLDVANWLLKGHPLKANGSCGRKARMDGDCNDTFTVNFWYADDIMLSFSSTQSINGFGALCNRVMGSDATVETNYGGEVWIHGKNAGWRGGNTGSIYKDGAVANIKAFHQSIMDSKPLNNIEESVNSTATAILGREAAYANGQSVTWDEMMKAARKLEIKLNLPPDGPKQPA
ncbi:MAG: Gfo/Idh/MocA family oxidoreductase [Candidatus Sumerlaeota bacterium]|nr:Gfo/Idh/MocA family oxidoreductase [Candidatus Sumerlaeota bacterium]